MTASERSPVSVLIATRNRAALLERALRSLAVAAVSPATAEIVVIDNGSADDTPRLLGQWACAAAGRRWLSVAEPGKSRALNCALAVAHAPLLAFTDDDVEVAPTYLDAIVDFFAAHPEYAAAIGRVLPPPAAADAAVLERVARYRTIAFFDHGDAVRDERTLHGSNMVVRREAFDAVGMFNEQLGPGAAGGMEDQDLGARITGVGLRIGYMPKVIVYHAIDTARLTPAYFRHFQLVQARSRLAMDPQGAWRRALPRLVESALGFAWWSLVMHPRRREHARGRMLRNADILRLHWRGRRAARQR